MRAPELSDAEGAALVAAARRAVEGRLGVRPDGPPPRVPDIRAGVFVTIRRAGALRGCIGLPAARGALAGSLCEAAVAAATADARFEPVAAGELDSLTFEVSILSEPEAIPGDRAGYASAIRVGRDGLVVERGPHSGLLLPQVATEFSWGAGEFLDRACEKAGLAAGAWRDARTAVRRFTGVAFCEESPRGRVARA